MFAIRRFPPSNFFKQRLLPVRSISTSKKNEDTAVTPLSTAESCAAPKKNWISYGFSMSDEKEDQDGMHSTMFFGITVAFVFGGFILAYRPDDLGRDWAQREGYLELRRRESLNLPLVDPNYIPTEKINLPSDEELGDTEIII